MENQKNLIFNQKFDAIIVGSGMSALTLAAIMSKIGQKVLILEKHFKIGGYTHTFKRKEYEWDVGIHYIGQVHKPYSISRRVFDYISEKRLKWVETNPNYDRFIFPDSYYDFVAPKEKFIDTMNAYFPNETDALNKYLNLVANVHKASKSYFQNKAMPTFLSKLMYKWMTNDFHKLASQTTKEVLNSLTNNKKFIGVITGQWGDLGVPPGKSSFAMQAMILNHYLDGANYPIGGSRMISESIVPTIENVGGKIIANAGVEEVIVKNKKAIGVKLESGDELYSELIISSAGIANTYGKLINGSKYQKLFNDRLNQLQPSGGYVCLYIGLKGSAKDFNFNQTNLWIYPDYDHDKNIEKYSKNPKEKIPLLYISFPSSKDPAWEKNHGNTSTIEAITMDRFEWYDKWSQTYWKKRPEDYRDYKENLKNRILEIVYKHVPQIKNKIDFVEISTPLTNRDLANYPKGELYGLDHVPERFQAHWLRPQTEIKNFYLTGQDITSAGLTGALFSGVLTASSIYKKNILKLIYND